MQDSSSNNKRIAKNTLILYGRMLVLMFIGLFTSRVVLNALGVVDFGIYSVVGGFTGLFAIVTQSMSSTISRYVTFELGKGIQDKMSRVFCTSVNIQIIYAIVIVLLAETLGLWFVNEKLVIPEERVFAANILYQLSILSMVLSLISVPYDACIVAHERMSVFAWITMYDAVGKLVVAYTLYLHLMDNLILFGLLLAGIAWTQRGIYLWYCKRNFQECAYKWILDKPLLKNMFSFAGWNLIGSSSAVLRDQGGNILINLFFGPTVNAARGIANNVLGKVTSFAGSFMTALNPQLTKSYASGDKDAMFDLIYKGARFSHFLMFIFILPILLNAEYILQLWLGMVPEHSAWFIRLILIFTMFEALSNPLMTAVKATGKIRNYQIVVGGLQMLNLPIIYVCFQMGCPAESHLLVAIVIGQLCLFARLIILHRQIGLRPFHFLKHVYLKIISVSLLSSIFPFAAWLMMNEGFPRFVITSLFSIIMVGMTAYYLGCTSHERLVIVSKIRTWQSNHSWSRR